FASGASGHPEVFAPGIFFFPSENAPVCLGFGYKSVLGRGLFLQSDPINFGGGDTNLYRAMGNNPVNRIDPDGRGFLAWMIGLGLAAGALYGAYKMFYSDPINNALEALSPTEAQGLIDNLRDTNSQLSEMYNNDECPNAGNLANRGLEVSGVAGVGYVGQGSQFTPNQKAFLNTFENKAFGQNSMDAGTLAARGTLSGLSKNQASLSTEMDRNNTVINMLQQQLGK
ncbi:MAG: hypothetical protein PHV34_22255, partial [Verrucomicrobiae bacterium]|nr:hypothetical protein [Verrucomicrobiae bacterium]